MVLKVHSSLLFVSCHQNLCKKKIPDYFLQESFFHHFFTQNALKDAGEASLRAFTYLFTFSFFSHPFDILKLTDDAKSLLNITGSGCTLWLLPPAFLFVA